MLEQNFRKYFINDSPHVVTNVVEVIIFADNFKP